MHAPSLSSCLFYFSDHRKQDSLLLRIRMSFLIHFREAETKINPGICHLFSKELNGSSSSSYKLYSWWCSLVCHSPANNSYKTAAAVEKSCERTDALEGKGTAPKEPQTLQLASVGTWFGPPSSNQFICPMQTKKASYTFFLW